MAFEVSIYKSIRERGPNPDRVQLAEAVERASREIIAAPDARASSQVSCAGWSSGSHACRSAATPRG